MWKLLFSLIAICLCVSDANATPARVQGLGQDNNTTIAATVVVTLGAAVGSGHLITVGVGWADPGAVDTVTCTDDKANTYTQADIIHPASTIDMATLYAANVTNGPTIITCTISTSRQFGFMVIDEWSGIQTVPIDGHTGKYTATPGTGADAATSGTITLPTTGDLIYGVALEQGGAGTLSLGTGFSAATSLGIGVKSEFLIQGSATAATFTLGNAADNSQVFIMAFKATASGSSGNGSLSLMGAGQ